MCGNENGAIKTTASILPLLMQILKTELIGLVGNHVFSLVTNQINYNEQYSPRLDAGRQYFRQAQHPQIA